LIISLEFAPHFSLQTSSAVMSIVCIQTLGCKIEQSYEKLFSASPLSNKFIKSPSFFNDSTLLRAHVCFGAADIPRASQCSVLPTLTTPLFTMVSLLCFAAAQLASNV